MTDEELIEHIRTELNDNPDLILLSSLTIREVLDAINRWERLLKPTEPRRRIQKLDPWCGKCAYGHRPQDPCIRLK